GILGVLNIAELGAISSPLQGMPLQMRQLIDASHLNGLAQTIRYYDEVLTQSARNYAFTGDKKWKDRYETAVPELDKAIQAAKAEGDEQDEQFFSSVDSANIALVGMEE
ncbi:MAG: hypothetical protein NTV88_04770, partial [Candidatus Micrarchaeota archaeon]|nr:hypothetical protein [Candidatus Micrarchaeota archaeon]